MSNAGNTLNAYKLTCGLAPAIVLIQGAGFALAEGKRKVNMASNILSGAVSETESQFFYRVTMIDGEDALVAAAFIGIMEIDYMGCDMCTPGNDEYEEAMARFREELKKDMKTRWEAGVSELPAGEDES